MSSDGANAKIGRPTKQNDELIATICERLSEGESLRSICRDSEMPDKTTVLRWLKESAGFRTQYEIAREVQADYYAEEILEIADAAEVDSAAIQKARLQIDARKWTTSKLLPKKYGPRLQQDHTVGVNVDLVRTLEEGRTRALNRNKPDN